MCVVTLTIVKKGRKFEILRAVPPIGFFLAEIRGAGIRGAEIRGAEIRGAEI